MHYSVGAIIEREGVYFLLERKNPPLGYAGIAGHVDIIKGKPGELDVPEDPLVALLREGKEESGLELLEPELIFEEELPWNWCSKGIGVHYWRVYKAKSIGKAVHNPHESKSSGWFLPKEMQRLPLEPVWGYWFNKLKII